MNLYIFLGLVAIGFTIALAWFFRADKKFMAIREGLPIVVAEQATKARSIFGKLTSLEWWKARKKHQWYLILSMALLALGLALILSALWPSAAPALPTEEVTKPAVYGEISATPPCFSQCQKAKPAPKQGQIWTGVPTKSGYVWVPANAAAAAATSPSEAALDAPIVEAPPVVVAKPVIPLTARQQAYEDRQAGRSLSFNQEK